MRYFFRLFTCDFKILTKLGGFNNTKIEEKPRDITGYKDGTYS